jgi:hypothetical protein
MSVVEREVSGPQNAESIPRNPADNYGTGPGSASDTIPRITAGRYQHKAIREPSDNNVPDAITSLRGQTQGRLGQNPTIPMLVCNDRHYTFFWPVPSLLYPGSTLAQFFFVSYYTFPWSVRNSRRRRSLLQLLLARVQPLLQYFLARALCFYYYCYTCNLLYDLKLLY